MQKIYRLILSLALLQAGSSFLVASDELWGFDADQFSSDDESGYGSENEGEAKSCFGDRGFGMFKDTSERRASDDEDDDDTRRSKRVNQGKRVYFYDQGLAAQPKYQPVMLAYVSKNNKNRDDSTLSDKHRAVMSVHEYEREYDEHENGLPSSEQMERNRALSSAHKVSQQDFDEVLRTLQKENDPQEFDNIQSVLLTEYKTLLFELLDEYLYGQFPDRFEHLFMEPNLFLLLEQEEFKKVLDYYFAP